MDSAEVSLFEGTFSVERGRRTALLELESSSYQRRPHSQKTWNLQVERPLEPLVREPLRTSEKTSRAFALLFQG